MWFRNSLIEPRYKYTCAPDKWDNYTNIDTWAWIILKHKPGLLFNLLELRNLCPLAQPPSLQRLYIPNLHTCVRGRGNGVVRYVLDQQRAVILFYNLNYGMYQYCSENFTIPVQNYPPSDPCTIDPSSSHRLYIFYLIPFIDYISTYIDRLNISDSTWTVGRSLIIHFTAVVSLFDNSFHSRPRLSH